MHHDQTDLPPDYGLLRPLPGQSLKLANFADYGYDPQRLGLKLNHAQSIL